MRFKPLYLIIYITLITLSNHLAGQRDLLTQINGSNKCFFKMNSAEYNCSGISDPGHIFLNYVTNQAHCPVTICLDFGKLPDVARIKDEGFKVCLTSSDGCFDFSDYLFYMLNYNFQLRFVSGCCPCDSDCIITINQMMIIPGNPPLSWYDNFDPNNGSRDGGKKESSPNLNNAEIQVFPNPVVDDLQIRLSLTLETQWIELNIYNNQGQLVKQINQKPEAHGAVHALEINVSDLPAGTFIYELKTANHNYSGKFSKL